MRQLLYILTFLLSFGCVIAQEAEKPKKPKKLLKNAEKFLKAGDVYTAIDNLEDYVDMVDDDFIRAFELAEMYLLARDYVKARDLYKRIFDADNTNYRKAQYYYGVCLKHTATIDLDKEYSTASVARRNQLLEEASGIYQEAKENLKVFSKKYRGADKSAFKKKSKNDILGCDLALKYLKKPDMLKVEHLDKNVNMAYTDMSPMPMGKNKLVYASMKSDTVVYVDASKKESKPFYTKLYIAEKEDSAWVFQGEFDTVFNHPDHHTGNAVLSVDKTKLYFSRCDAQDDGIITCDIWFSTKDPDGVWQEPQPFYEINTKKYTETQPAIGYDPRKKREIIYFVSDREDGSRGGLDIWYTYFDDRKRIWKEPANCKTKINTTGNEMTPYYDLESGTMYFSSNFWPGIGGMDVFKSIGTMKKWSGKPVNMRFPVNSGADDLYYVLDETGESGFMSTNRTGGYALKNPTCCDDIYAFKWINVVRVYAEGIVLDEADSTETPLINSVVSLFMIDSESGEEVLIKTDTTLEDDTDYMFKLQPHKRYKISAHKKGYFTNFTNISTKGVLKSDTMRAPNILLQKIPPKDSTITIKNIYYDFDSPELTPPSKDTLESNLVSFLKANPTIVIEIGAHTDSKGTELYNQQLSQQRAESVVRFLVEKGISEKRLVPLGYGETNPIAPNSNEDGSDNPEGREKNRRTEFKVKNELPEHLIIDYEE